jgi:tetratricopeptide (TPR) repeat protein
MKKSLLLLLFLVSSTNIIAQPGWNWPENKAEAEEKNVLYTDYLKQQNCEAAVEHVDWLIDNVPNLHVSIYQNGIKIYRCLIDKESDPIRKAELVEKALSLFDGRIENFGREAYVKNRKVTFAYTFYRSDKSQYEPLFDMFKDAFALNGNKIGNSNLVAYMDIVRKHKLTSKTITDDEVLDIYDMISKTISYKVVNDTKNQERYKKYQDNLDKLLTATVTVDCNFVENTLGPKLLGLTSEPTDEIAQTDYETLTPVDISYSEEVINLAKKIFQLSITGKCTSSEIALEAAKIMFTNENDFAIAKFIAGREQANKNYESSLKYYDEAIKSTEDNSQKSEIYLNKAQLYAVIGNKVKSRNNARRSISMNSGNTDAYKLIGNLYMSSYDECREGKSRVQDRLVFIAAYNIFKSGGLNSQANQAREQFPSMEEIFNENMEVGESMNTGCWINETVTLNKR